MLRCSGDEDVSTRGVRRNALSRATRAAADVIVDLSELTFADASLMVDIAMLARRLRLRGFAVQLRGPSPHIYRLIELVGLNQLPGVRLEGPAPTPA
ncbi:MAG: hypothetical protein QOD76_110 [Solirubrobacteraceae bacterium]|nr:hypothetical protein [Solirubrobacteraceae bacterium]